MTRNKFQSKRTGSFLLLAFMHVGALTTSAQTYTLEESIDMAMQNNTQILNHELSSIAAKYKMAELKGSLLPRVDLSAQYQYYLNLPEQYAPASAFGGPEGEYSLLSLNMPQTMGSQILLTQPLINKEIRARIAGQEIVREMTFIQTDLTKENVKYNVIATYYSIQVLQDNLYRLQENIINLEQTAKINAVLNANELIAANVHQRLLINLESLRNEYDNQKLSIEKNLTVLKYLMHVPIDDTIAVVPFEYTEEHMRPFAADVTQRADLRLQRAQIDLTEHDLQTVLARYAPVVTANFASGFTGYNDNLEPYRQINGDWINGTYFSVQAKVPLFAGYQKKHQVSQQKISIQQGFNTLSQMQLQAEKEVRDATQTYFTTQSQLRNTSKSLDLASQLFTSVQTDYANGISTMTDLLNAQNDLTSARTNYSSALLSLKLAELSLKKAYGLL